MAMLIGGLSEAAARQYVVEIEAPSPIRTLLERHLEISRSIDNPRLNDAECRRLSRTTPRETRALIATEGYFDPIIESKSDNAPQRSTAKFKIDPGEQAVISAVDIKFSGEITLQPTDDDTLSVRQLQESWELSEDQPFTQEAW